MKTIKPGLYRHSETGIVISVAFVARHKSNYSMLVIYKGPKGEIIAHPYEDFISEVKLNDGSIISMFQLLEE